MVQSSQIISYLQWLPMQPKNTHLKNFNKLDLQCPQREKQTRLSYKN